VWTLKLNSKVQLLDFDEDGAQSAPSSFLGFDLVYTMFEAAKLQNLALRN
jgi:hypothetical protein